ncbi:carboxypeptidase N subunit 2-like [Sitophilus oryzae]|uniref:Carboxypeptidase N subunit 2-like n=1 Tax=Sitophilus oryzae TaxID=7048 RepID=A0A6J2YX26_SITOR|nr:carboxypeptidase N subunit 2-like [Sitophilus oryzae]
MFIRYGILVFLLVFHRSSSLEPLCSSGKFRDKCLCKKIINEDTKLPSAMAECTALSLKMFPSSEQFPSNLTLSILDLSLNEIDTLDPSIVDAPTTLRRLVLSYNKINYINTNFFVKMTDLRYLDLSHNNIKSLDNSNVFSSNANLVHLELSFNQLIELPQGIFQSLPLKYLDIGYNNFGNFMTNGSKDILDSYLGVNTYLTHLKLNNLSLKELHPDYFTQYTTLTHLEIMDNGFEVIPSVPYSVEYLDVSGNNLTYLSARHLNYHSLKVLRASRMPSLASIHHYAFYNLQALEKLVITDCPNLKEFTELAFGLASKTKDIHPKSLILARNGLTTLNSTYRFMFRHMEHVNLLYNPWYCDCEILWLQEFDNELFDGKQIRCASPQDLRSRKILELKDEDLVHCHPEIYGKHSHKVLIVGLMGVIIVLAAFILFLIRYPGWLNPRRIGVGPESPYSPAPQEDNHI